MRIEGTPNVSVANYLLSGFYQLSFNKGIKPRLFELSSPVYPIGNFQAPYDVILPAPAGGVDLYTAVGHKIRNPEDGVASNRSGKFYYFDRADLYGVCHGYGRNVLTHYLGYNFYQAFYPGGYFAPPYGENVSIYKGNQDGTDNLINGGCPNLDITEYNSQFGIPSMTAQDIGLTTNSLSPDIMSPIYSPRETCPPEIAITNYFDEVNFHQIAGTSSQFGGGIFYNGNPIPISLDIYNIQVNGRYRISGAGDNKFILRESGRGLPSYHTNSQQNALNNTICQAGLMETDVAAGRGTNGMQLIETPDLLPSKPGDQVFFPQGIDTAFFYWHFTFKENAATLPFYNNFTSIDTSTTRVTNRSINQGTQLFLPILSSEESYWQNRQCPDTVDFLPHTFGASIYACPSEHFDVPYYAAIKKFGFYGTRFLNTCNKLNLDYTWSGVPHASELPEGNTPIQILKDETEPAGLDSEGSWSFGAYDNLLKTAYAEERYSNMYALNKGFFLWANKDIIYQTQEWQRLSVYSGFVNLFSGLVGKFALQFPDGLTGFVRGAPKIQLSNVAGSPYPVDTGNYSDLMFTNKAYRSFYDDLEKIIPSTGLANWFQLENAYGSYVSDGVGIHENFYAGIVSGREQRLLTRYLENTVKGNPIDLFPLNHITFSFDQSKDYLEHSGWGRGLNPFSRNELPEIARRYFQGAYGNASEITGLAQTLAALQFSTNTAFYPGFFNNYAINKDLPTPSYVPVISGQVRDSDGRKFSASGWLALGYNEIGQLDGNFSCFTPIFTQQPVPKVFTKIGQAPQFKVFAVDYHSIPEDKISYRYPEIVYWAYKLKLVDNKMRSLYPVRYKWLRVPKTQYANWLASGDLSNADYSHPSGNWACAEGDGAVCTLIHPLESSPTGIKQDYVFKKGAKLNEDDQYYYMCLASGRFGVRISEPSELHIEDWVRFDVSLKNAMNYPGKMEMSFGVYDTGNAYHSIDFEASETLPNYNGYQRDEFAIPEAVCEQKIPPPNAGFGDVTAFRFVGPIGYVGATRSYQPDTLKDTRGVRGAWGRFIEYGSLVPFEKNLTQLEGDLLYGYQHLPKCSNYQMAAGRKGVSVIGKFAGYLMSHWTLPQQAVATTDSTFGIPWQKLDNLGALYPPITASSYNVDLKGQITLATPAADPINGHNGIGHWQWGNNLGAIKRFGYLSTPESDDLVFVGKGAPRRGQITQPQLDEIKRKILIDTHLAGDNCGYTPLGLGRNMLYYLEAYERFYFICDLLKKKNVRNLSFICPGLRSTNSAIQYCWLGHPTNTSLERRPMYGPYAYQWKVKRHNRDRNGNGMSEGFYSMGWAQRYTMMYDAPAVYGLYVKTQPTNEYAARVNQVVQARNEAFPDGVDLIQMRNRYIGVMGTEGTAKPYPADGIPISCTSGHARYSEVLCNYLDLAQDLSTNLDFKAYGCNQNQLINGQCFDPCISMRYGQGFFPGGKAQNLFGYTSSISQNQQPKNMRLVPSANLDVNGQIIDEDEQSLADKNTFFRAPTNTPHARIIRGLTTIDNKMRPQATVMGISTCEDGGSDHCNFITPTVHLGTSTVLLNTAMAFMVAKNYAANLYEAYNIRGDES